MTNKYMKNHYNEKKYPLLLLFSMLFSISFGNNMSNTKNINVKSTFNINEVTGKVTDENGLPLPGANVIIKGTLNGTQTDFDGNFLINVNPGDTITISYIGYVSQDIIYTGQETITANLKIATDALSEIVVVGFTSKSTRDITGSIEVVDVENLQKTAPVSIEQALQGQASGVTVSNQGGPGGGASVRIRGFSSINGADPLYVIDGTPTGSGLNDINPSDIESIQVLKDASSSAIYGNRAANGVIIVTTKKGKRNQKAKLSISSWTGIDFIPKSVFPNLATPQQIANAEFQQQRNGGNDSPTSPQYGSGTAVLPNFILPEGANTADLSLYSLENPISRANKSGTNWFDEYFSPAIVNNINAGVSGGSEDSQYYAGFGVLDQNGIGLETYYRRYNTRLNSEFKINERLTIGENINIAYSKRVQFGSENGDENSDENRNNNLDNAIISLYRIHPIIPVRDVSGNFSGSRGAGLGNAQNPIATAIQNKDNRVNQFRTTGNIFAAYELIDGLTAKTNFGLDYLTSESRRFRPIRLFDQNQKVTNDLRENANFNTNYNWFNTLTYDATLGDRHKINALVGTEFVKVLNKDISGTGQDLPFDDEVDTQFLNQSAGTSRSSKSAGFNSSLFSVFGKIDYKYDDKYLFSATLRRDGSSKFGGENNKDLRVGYFPSVSVGWRLSKERFLESSSVITNLLIKSGYGEIGSDNIPPGLDVDVVSQNPQFDAYPFGGVVNTGASILIRGNENLSWETKKTLNLGLDISLIHKIDIGFEYFNTKTVDVLNIISSDPSILGNVNNFAANVGEISNEGFDANINFTDATASGFNYSIGANISVYKNEVEILDPINSKAQIFGAAYGFGIGSINNTLEGEPVASFYGLNYLGINQTTGRAEYEDLDGNGEIDGKDRQVIGNPHPDFTFGINFSADYKNFDLSLLFQGSQGNDVFNLPRVFTETSIFTGAKSVNYVNAWTPTNTGASVPALTDDAEANGLERLPSSFFIEDGSYIRLKNIQLGYNLPESVCSLFKLDSFRIYLQGKNLITLTDYSGLDPEISVRNFNNTASSSDARSNNIVSLGVDTGTYPISRSVLFGVQISL